MIVRITQERGPFATLSEEALLDEIEYKIKNGTDENDEEDEESTEIKSDDKDGKDTDVNESSVKNEATDSDTPSKLDDNVMDDETFEKTREKLIAFLAAAKEEAALSQDFVALLMSGKKPETGLKSMSPYLRANIPPGSLNADLARPDPHKSTTTIGGGVGRRGGTNHHDDGADDEDEDGYGRGNNNGQKGTTDGGDDDHLVCAGWKLESLERTSASLKSAAKRLRGEVVKETRYWDSVLAIVSNGEVIYKIRAGETRGLGVKYGFGDSGSLYTHKGQAVLRRLNDGTISFQTEGLGSKQNKIVRVTLYKIINGQRTKTSVSSPLLVSDFLKKKKKQEGGDDSSDGKDGENDKRDNLKVLKEIKHARSLLFEEELFFEMIQEARMLTSHRVTVTNDEKIVAHMYDEILEIDFVDPTEDLEHESECGRPFSDDFSAQLGGESLGNNDIEGRATEPITTTTNLEGLSSSSSSPFSNEILLPTRANLISTAFRILLCNFHRRNLQKKKQIPSPLTSTGSSSGTGSNGTPGTGSGSRKPGGGVNSTNNINTVNSIGTSLSTASATTSSSNSNSAAASGNSLSDIEKRSIFILRPVLAHVLHEKILKRTKKTLELLIENELQSVLSDESSSATINLESIDSSATSNSNNNNNNNKQKNNNDDVIITGKSVADSILRNSLSHLGKLAVQPLSKFTIVIPGVLVIVIITGSPIQSHSLLYEAAVYKWINNNINEESKKLGGGGGENNNDNELIQEIQKGIPISSNGFNDLSDLEDWVRWVLQTKSS